MYDKWHIYVFFNSAAGWKHENGSTVAEMSENFLAFLLEIPVAEIGSLNLVGSMVSRNVCEPFSYYWLEITLVSHRINDFMLPISLEMIVWLNCS